MSDYYEKLDKEKAAFLREASRHSIEVKLDNGTFRHLRFSRNNSSTYHFNITTWPGYLSISGDMGCFVFARATDMFEFFRGDRINPQYWAEKLQATSRGSGHEAFSFELLKEAVAADFENWDFESDEQKAEAWEKIAGDYGLLYDADGSDLQYAVGEIMDYECPVTKQKFEDFWDHNFHDYTHHFMWCCNAIQWGIHQYDLMKAAQPAPKNKMTVTGFRGNPLRVVLSGGQEAAITQNLIDAFASPSPFGWTLPQDVVNLVIAAREFWDAHNDLSDESRALDKALEPFAERVPYENDPTDNSEASNADA